MSPSEIVADATENAARFLAPVPHLLAQRDFSCYINLDVAVRDFVFAGLVRWRHALDDPRADFVAALKVAIQAREILLQAPWPDRWKLFHFPLAAVIDYLVEGTISDEVFAELANLSKKWPLADMPALLDSALAIALREKRIPKQFEALLGWFATNKRMKLMHREYSNYLSLLRRCEMDAPIEQEVRVAERLFLDRKKNGYYHSSAVDGGGPDNEHVVDFRLAAILKLCQEQHPEMSIPDTIHRWRW